MVDRIRNVPQPTSKTAKINVIPPWSIIEICFFIFRIPPKTPLELKVFIWKTMGDGLAVQAQKHH